MLTAEFCGACRDQVDERCRGSLLSAGVQKVHWECWSHCNLRCDFCYRTMSPPLDTEQASLLLRGIRTGGANTLVFAGGDMVTSDGHVYGVTEAESIRSGRHAHVGSFLTDHLSTLSRQVSIDPDKHARHLALEERAPTR